MFADRCSLFWLGIFFVAAIGGFILVSWLIWWSSGLVVFIWIVCWLLTGLKNKKQLLPEPNALNVFSITFNKRPTNSYFSTNKKQPSVVSKTRSFNILTFELHFPFANGIHFRRRQVAQVIVLKFACCDTESCQSSASITSSKSRIGSTLSEIIETVIDQVLHTLQVMYTTGIEILMRHSNTNHEETTTRKWNTRNKLLLLLLTSPRDIHLW